MPTFWELWLWTSDLILLSLSLHLQRGKLIPSRESACVEVQACAQGTGSADAWHAWHALAANGVPCARRFAAAGAAGEGWRRSGIPRGVGCRLGQRGSPRGPLPDLGARAIGRGGRVGGKMTSAAGWIIKARAEPRAQSAPSRRRAALGLAPTPQPARRSPARLPAGPVRPRCCGSAPLDPAGTMHLSQLLACALLLTLLSLRPSEAKPGAPAKVGASAWPSRL